jgi:hypothetical protein
MQHKSILCLCVYLILLTTPTYGFSVGTIVNAVTGVGEKIKDNQIYIQMLAQLSNINSVNKKISSDTLKMYDHFERLDKGYEFWDVVADVNPELGKNKYKYNSYLYHYSEDLDEILVRDLKLNSLDVFDKTQNVLDTPVDMMNAAYNYDFNSKMSYDSAMSDQDSNATIAQSEAIAAKLSQMGTNEAAKAGAFSSAKTAKEQSKTTKAIETNNLIATKTYNKTSDIESNTATVSDMHEQAIYDLSSYKNKSNDPDVVATKKNLRILSKNFLFGF